MKQNTAESVARQMHSTFI